MREIISVEKYLKEHYGAEPLANDEGEKYIDEGESLVCCFHFPDTDKRSFIIGNGEDYPDLRLLIIHDNDNKEVFIRICQGEAKGLSWEEVQKICRVFDQNEAI